MNLSKKLVSYLVHWCLEPSQPQRITSGLNTNFALSQTSLCLQLIHFKSHHTTSHVCLFLAYLYSVGTQHGNQHPAG